MSAATPPAPLYTPPAFSPERDEAGEIIYPSTDGLPMSWTTIHYDWLTFLKGGFEQHFASRPDVFVAGDLLWYPVEGHPEIAAAPDVFVAIGRPKGSRTSYRQWVEGGIAPQAVFEVLSSGNTAQEMVKKMGFYARHGVQEYILFDPNEPLLQVWVRDRRGLVPVDDPQGWRSPVLGATFWIAADSALHVVFDDGTKMLSHSEQAERAAAERQRAESEKQRAESEKERAESEKQRAEEERQRADIEKSRAENEKERAEKLAEKLRAMGIDPEAL